MVHFPDTTLCVYFLDTEIIDTSTTASIFTTGEGNNQIIERLLPFTRFPIQIRVCTTTLEILLYFFETCMRIICCDANCNCLLHLCCHRFFALIFEFVTDPQQNHDSDNHYQEQGNVSNQPSTVLVDGRHESYDSSDDH